MRVLYPTMKKVPLFAPRWSERRMWGRWTGEAPDAFLLRVPAALDAETSKIGDVSEFGSRLRSIFDQDLGFREGSPLISMRM